jgi:alkylation response protein AidB-like acyl-CoA dehydrogenase
VDVVSWPRQDSVVYEQIRKTAARFADDIVRPSAADLDREQRFPREIYQEMVGLGLFGITVPEDDGGAGLDALAYAMVMEELSRGYASVADQCGLVELIATLLAAHGTAEQKARFLQPVLSMATLVAYGITEAEAGSDVAGIRTSAARVNGGWRLSGEKLWIHNAPVGRQCHKRGSDTPGGCPQGAAG